MGTGKDGKDGSDGTEHVLAEINVQQEQVFREALKPCSLEANAYYAKQNIYKPEMGPLQVFNI